MSKSLRIVFMGTPDFAVASLDELHRSEHRIVGVVTSPDRPAGRGRKLRSSAVKEYAVQRELPHLQPEKLRNKTFLDALKALNADLFVIVAFRMLPEVVWSMPKKGTINLHGSLLPQYRGAAPINWAIMNGESHTGVTTFYIDAEIDKGEMIASMELPIFPEMTAGELHDTMMMAGAQHLLATVNAIAQEQVERKPQPEHDEGLKPAPKLNPENRKIQWTDTTARIHNQVRGLSPYPTALAHFQPSTDKTEIWKVNQVKVLEEVALPAGEVVSDGRSFIHVGTGDGALSLEEVQIPGKRMMSVRDLLNGWKLDAGSQFV